MDATPENLKRLAKIFDAETTAEAKKQDVPAPAEAETPPREEPEVQASPRNVSKEYLRKSGLELTKAGKSKELKSALAEFGAKKLGEVKEEDYIALAEKLEALT